MQYYHQTHLIDNFSVYHLTHHCLEVSTFKQWGRKTLEKSFKEKKHLCAFAWLFPSSQFICQPGRREGRDWCCRVVQCGWEMKGFFSLGWDFREMECTAPSINWVSCVQLLAVDGSVLRDALIHKKIIAKGEEVRAAPGALGGKGH